MMIQIQIIIKFFNNEYKKTSMFYKKKLFYKKKKFFFKFQWKKNWYKCDEREE